MMHDISRFLCRVFCRIYLRLAVTGDENIPARGGFIVASNHVSYLDPVAVGSASRRGLYYMARHDLFRFPLIGRLLRAVHAFPVRRDSADLSALKEALYRVRNNEGLLVFPEGRRSAASGFGEPEAGVGFLAAKSNVPVIPVLVTGTDKALPKGAKFIKPARVTVHFGPQILIERRLSYREVASLIMEKIRQLSCRTPQ